MENEEIFERIKVYMYEPTIKSLASGGPEDEVVSIGNDKGELMALIEIKEEGYRAYLTKMKEGKPIKDLKELLRHMRKTDLKDTETARKIKGSIIMFAIKSFGYCIVDDKCVERGVLLHREKGMIKCLASYDCNDDGDEGIIVNMDDEEMRIDNNEIPYILLVTDKTASYFNKLFGLGKEETYEFVEWLALEFSNYKNELKG